MKKLPITMRLREILCFLVTCFAYQPVLVTAQSQDDLVQASVSSRAEQYVKAELAARGQTDIKVEASPLDPRLQVPSCPEPFTTFANEESLTQSLVTVRVECKSSGWYLYTMVKVAQVQSVVVVTSALSPGSVLTAQDVELVEMDKKQLRSSTYADINTVIGARVKRRTRAGQPVVPNTLCFVCRGDSIVIIAGTEGLQIKTSGIAQQDGNIGDTIAVKNSNSQKMIHATVTSVSRVEVRI